MRIITILTITFFLLFSCSDDSSSSKSTQEESSSKEYKKLLTNTLLKFNSDFSENFIKNELNKVYNENCQIYYSNHLVGDINLDGKNDLLIYYGIEGKEEGAQIGLGWCLVFSDEMGFAKNYLIFDWGEGRCAPNHHSIGTPNKIINGNIIAVESFYHNDDPCCCPSITFEESYKFSDGQLLLNSNTNSIIKPSIWPLN